MIYISKALFDVLDEKQQKTFMDFIKSIHVNPSSYGYGGMCVEVASDTGTVRSKRLFTKIPNMALNSGMIDEIINLTETVESNKIELAELQKLKTNLDGIKNYIKGTE